jgi:hypothetical protein
VYRLLYRGLILWESAMNVKPLLLGLVAAALVTTVIVKTTSESDKVVYAPAPLVETVPAPLPPVRPVLKPVAKHLVKVKHVVPTH